MPSSPFARSARFSIGLFLLSIPVAECRAQTAFGFPYPNPFDPVVHAQLVVELALAAPQRMRIAVVDLRGRLTGERAQGARAHRQWTLRRPLPAALSPPAAGLGRVLLLLV